MTFPVCRANQFPSYEAIAASTSYLVTVLWFRHSIVLAIMAFKTSVTGRVELEPSNALTATVAISAIASTYAARGAPVTM
jgi:hypothetical protein